MQIIIENINTGKKYIWENLANYSVLENNPIPSQIILMTDHFDITPASNVLYNGHRFSRVLELKNEDRLQYFDKYGVLESFKVLIENSLAKNSEAPQYGDPIYRSKYQTTKACIAISNDCGIPIYFKYDPLEFYPYSCAKLPENSKMGPDGSFYYIPNLEYASEYSVNELYKKLFQNLEQRLEQQIIQQKQNREYSQAPESITTGPPFGLNNFAEHCFREAKSCGFHREETRTNPPNLAKYLMNLHAEISELWEAFRNNNLNNPCDKSEKMKSHGIESLTCLEEELADIIIRCGDTAAAFEIDLEKAVVNKMKFNRTRGYRNGGKEC